MNSTSVKIEEMIPINATGKIVLQAFTGSGLVASLVSHHLIDKFDLTEKGYVSSPLIPSIGIVRNGVVQRPVRVFENDQYLLILSEVGIPKENLNEFIEGLFSWYMQIEPSSIVIIGALPTGRPIDASDLRYSMVSSDEVTKSFLEQKGLKISQRSAVYGSVAMSLMEAAKCNMSAMAVLPHCIASIPDYLAAKKSIELLSVILDVEISVTPLDVNATELKEHLLRRKNKRKDRNDTDDDLDEFNDFVSDIMDITDDEEDPDDFDLSRFR